MTRCLSCTFFFFNDTATTEIYTLSLHDALPICMGSWRNVKLIVLRLPIEEMDIPKPLIGNPIDDVDRDRRRLRRLLARSSLRKRDACPAGHRPGGSTADVDLRGPLRHLGSNDQIDPLGAACGLESSPDSHVINDPPVQSLRHALDIDEFSRDQAIRPARGRLLSK